MLKTDENKKKFLHAIGNEARLKILRALWKSDLELTIYKISRFTGLGRHSVVRHIQNLVERELVLKKVYGEIPVYTINKDKPEAKALIEFFRKVRL